MSLNRVFISYLCVGLLSLLGSCDGNNDLDENLVIASTPTFSSTNGESSSDDDSLLIHFSKVSLISQEGKEVEVDPNLFQEKWDLFTLSVDEAAPSSFDHMYTVVAWDIHNQPYVIQVSKNELKVGHYYFTGERISQFILWMKQRIGGQYLSTLSMDRMTLQANDIGVKSQIPDEKAVEIYEQIQTATLIKGNAPIDTPLYPYYQLVVEYSGKDFLNIDVLSPTLISLHDGLDRWYFELNSSIFSSITSVIPVTDYSKNHIKHLFNAEDLNIQDFDHILNLSKHYDDALKEKAAIHHITRILSDGKPSANEEVGEVLQTMEFIFSDNTTTQLIVYDDYFMFNNELHILKGVREKIKSFLEHEKK